MCVKRILPVLFLISLKVMDHQKFSFTISFLGTVETKHFLSVNLVFEFNKFYENFPLKKSLKLNNVGRSNVG